jgi:hypothetical protein
MTLEEEIMRAIQSGIAKAISERLNSYNSPLEKLIQESVAARSSDIKKLLDDSMGEALAAEGFRDTIKSSLRKKLGDLLIQRFGGDLEKQVNALKSDPATRARVTVAIDEIIKSTAKA